MEAECLRSPLVIQKRFWRRRFAGIKYGERGLTGDIEHPYFRLWRYKSFSRSDRRALAPSRFASTPGPECRFVTNLELLSSHANNCD